MSQESKGGNELTAGGPLVLVAEDEQGLHLVIEDSLTDGGFRSLIVTNGQEALAAVREAEPAALVTDIRLPGLDGWEIARAARELHPDLPVIYISGDSAADWSAKGVPKSIMLAKPFAMAQLVTAISQLLNAEASK